MDFLKRHYEKVLLGVVLVGLAAAAVFLTLKVPSEKQKLEDLRATLTHPKVRALSNLDLSMPENVLKRMVIPAAIDFSTTNRLFNPMAWQQTRDNRLIRADKAGPTAAIVTNIVPLYLRLSFDSVNITPDGSAKYVIGVQREAAPTPKQRIKQQAYMKVGDKNETFALSGITGPAENPTNVLLTLNDSGERVTLSKAVPYKRVDGYMADLRYEPEKQSWPARRVGSAPLTFNGETYNIVAITTNEVVLSARNQKKWTIRTNVAPP